MLQLRSLLIVLVLSLIVASSYAQEDLIPGLDDFVPTGEITGELEDAVNKTNDLPDDILETTGLKLDPNVDRLFGYIKYLLSATVAYELLGETLAPIGITVMIVINLVIVLTSAWFIVNLVIFIVKFIMWVFSLILKIIEIIVSILAALASIAGAAIDLLGGTLGKLFGGVMDWIGGFFG